MFATVRLRLGGVVAVVLLAVSAPAGAATVDLDYTTFNRSKLDAGPGRAGRLPRRLLGREHPCRGLQGLQALGGGQGHPEPAVDQGRQLHPVRQDRHRRRGGRQRREAAGQERQQHALGPLPPRRHRRAAPRQLARQQRQPRHQVADQGRRRVRTRSASSSATSPTSAASSRSRSATPSTATSPTARGSRTATSTSCASS